MQIGALIRKAGLQYKDLPCLREADRLLSFAEFDAATDRLGNALLALGLAPGDRVGVLMPNSIDCLIAYYALAKSGLVRVSLNVRDTFSDLQYKIGHSGARGLIHATEHDFAADFVIGQARLSELIAGGGAAPCAVDRDPEAPYRLGYTGGTTGKPKAVTLTERGEMAELSSFLMDLTPEISMQDTFLHAAPIAHASGAFFLPALVRGAGSVIMPKFDPAGFLDMTVQEDANMTFLVPTMLAMILEQEGLERMKGRYKRICYGASPISPSVLARGEQAFGRVFAQTYGQAESPMVITCLQPEDHDRQGSCGRPYTVAEVAVFDDDDNPLSPGEEGEIVCRGPQLMARYWDNPDATEKAFRNGWLHTGDVGRMDDDGFFYILDRKNDMLISGGFNVYPREVEDALLGFEGVVEAAVIGIPDETWGDRVHAVVAGREGLDTDALLAHARGVLPKYKAPKSIDLWPDLPKSGANKILRREVRETVLKRIQASEDTKA